MQLHKLTIQEAHNLLKTKEISSRELTQAILDRIDAVENKVDAFLTVAATEAIPAAEEADQQISRGNISPLTGIPLGIKDLICTKNLKTTCGSRILENFIPPYDATVIKKLKREYAVIVGKMNMDEFAMGSSNEHSGYKVTRNPWDLSRIPGGSSGGSAAAVAADMCLATLGSDTGGSIRQPASHCGIVGLKPTYGRVSRFGLVAFASSLDQIGPLTKSVWDGAAVLNAISGYDDNDSTSVPKEVPDFTSFLTSGLNGVTIGIPKEVSELEGLDPEVASAIEATLGLAQELGAQIVEVSLPNTEHVVAVYYVIAPCEASSNLARYDGVKYGYRDGDQNTLMEMYRSTRTTGFGPEVQRRIIIGTYCLSAGYYDAYYGKASQVRTLIVEDYKRAFEKCDVIFSPVAPTPAFKIGEKVEDPLKMYLSDIFTLSANLAGVPGMSVPCGFSSNGLPIGLQILSRHFNEGMMLKAAYNIEQVIGQNNRKPKL